MSPGDSRIRHSYTDVVGDQRRTSRDGTRPDPQGATSARTTPTRLTPGTRHAREERALMDTPHDSVIRPDRLLLAIDGSEDAILAARVATDLSRRTGARLHVAHAWYHLVKGLAYPTLVWADYSDLYEREARKILETQVDEIEAAD